MNANAPIPFPHSSRSLEAVAFDRKELGLILRIYGRMVANGEWRDYAIAAMRDPSTIRFHPSAIPSSSTSIPFVMAIIVPLPPLKQRMHQFLGIGMLRVLEDLVGKPLLHDLPVEHDHGPVR